jgi:cyanophycinase
VPTLATVNPNSLVRALPLGALILTACARGATSSASPSNIKVGPPNGGSVVVVGGGSLGPEIYRKFIELAGGPDALIIDIPTAGGAPNYTDVTGTRAQFEAAGAKNVKVLHTYDRKIAESDTFVAYIKRAGGVWFDGGRQYRLFDAYGGTKSETAFHDLLARGGVVGGSSAGASILGSFMVRGAPSNDNSIMAYPGYEKGFGFLRNTGIDQHVVARERQPDMADSLLPKHPKLLFISEDEGTAWVVQGDNAEIIGRSKAFAYNGKANDPGRPFLTLWPGDRYNLADRVVTHRAIEGSTLTQAFVDSVFRASVGSSMATVLVAQAGQVLVNTSYNVPPQRRYMPGTTIPTFDLGGISAAINGAVASNLVGQNRLTWDDKVDEAGALSVRQCLDTATSGCDRQLVATLAKKGGAAYLALSRRVTGGAGMPKTTVDSVTGAFRSNVDELYRLELTAFGSPTSVVSDMVTVAAPGWQLDRRGSLTRQAAYSTRDGKRGAFVRFPDRRAAIIVLTDSDAVDARLIADRIAEKLLGPR